MPLSARQFEVESQLLVRYRAAEISARQMLAAAHQADWDTVSNCESRFRKLALRPEPEAIGNGSTAAERRQAGEHASPDDRQPTHRLSPAAHRERLRAIRRLILIDAEVRRLCDPQAAKLDAMLSV
ncbi:MAG TPA: hypothetical protein PK177_03415 [Burkholderiaceae bacterium]|mgnify:CR=1 FL=1|nr:hypothetical protein [Burkholderiaceae bacterium]